MSGKSFVYIGMFLGSTLGGYLPTLWGADFISVTTVLTSTLGGILGVLIAYKLTKNY